MRGLKVWSLSGGSNLKTRLGSTTTSVGGKYKLEKSPHTVEVPIIRIIKIVKKTIPQAPSHLTSLWIYRVYLVAAYAIISEESLCSTDLFFIFRTRFHRVEYDDGDMGWVVDLSDESKVKFLDSEVPAEAPELMASVATSVETHAGGVRTLAGQDGDASSDREPSVSFNVEPTAVIPAAEDATEE